MRNLRIVAISLLVLLLSATGVYATESAVPVLISEPVTESIRGEYVSYDAESLIIMMDEKTYPVTVEAAKVVEAVPFTDGGTLGEQLTDLPEGTLLDMTVTHGEASYVLVTIDAVHIRMYGGAAVVTKTPLTFNDRFESYDVVYNDEVIEFDVQPQLINDRVMVPLRFIAEVLGYEVTWNEETSMVDLQKGPNFTSIRIGENAYFRNRMAPSELSAAPTIVEGRTMVPVEFITEIIGLGVQFEANQLKIYDESFTTLTGFVSEIKDIDGKYTMVTVAPREGDDIEMYEITVLIVNEDTIINRAPLAVGDRINGVHLPMMTMSIPAQTSAVVIY